MDHIDMTHLDHIEDPAPTPIPQWEQDYYDALMRQCEPPALAERLGNTVGYTLATALVVLIFWSVI